jgi:6-pyruvoyltetrahydropterin/6-carboxytetrahydropterin synthase
MSSKASAKDAGAGFVDAGLQSGPRKQHATKPAIPTVELGRRYRFAASHRLHSASLSDAQNRAIYGKCDNPHGHGHNYVMEVVVSGPVDSATGMIANLADLDTFVEKNVLQEYDHKSFNEDVAAFRDVVPTTENLCIDIFQRLKPFPLAKLERIRVEETGNNSFEYAGEHTEEPRP